MVVPAVLILAALARPEVADLHRACDAGRSQACAQLATIYSSGEGVPPMPNRAARLWKKACDAHEVEACFALGMMWASGEGTVAADERRSAALLTQACDGGHGLACFVLGMAEAMKNEGTGAAGRSRDLRARACRHGVGDACNDPIEASQQWARGCEKGDGDDCMSLLRREPARARLLIAGLVRRLQASCDAGGMGFDGCFGLGALYLHNQAGEWAPQRAIEAFHRACAAQFTSGCQGLHRLSTDDQVRKDAALMARIREACTMPAACGMRGKWDVADDPPLGDEPGRP